MFEKNKTLNYYEEDDTSIGVVSLEENYNKLFSVFFSEIDKRLINDRVVVAIEGGSASGKSTLAEIISSKYDCTVFHMDDFFLRPEQRNIERFKEVGGNIDKERFIEEVLKPLSGGKNILYKKFDCSTMTLGEEIEVTPKKLIIVEGVYSMHPEFGEYYDLSVFLDISPNFQRKRIVDRNGIQLARRFFNEWIPLENEYFTKTNIKQRCDMVIDVL